MAESDILTEFSIFNSSSEMMNGMNEAIEERVSNTPPCITAVNNVEEVSFVVINLNAGIYKR